MNIVGLDLVESRWLRLACTSICNRVDTLTNHAVLDSIRIPPLDHAMLDSIRILPLDCAMLDSIRVPMSLPLDHAIRMKYLNQ
jgi:hypothetical protein